ncbi:MAG: hypothetical protein KDJ29_05070 [Hyphomicrobiales bacterium]|nr:hypothetical protein [Hyphomicrobiales bacterium]
MANPLSESKVNTTTAGDQDWSTVAALADGGWIVIWDSTDGSDSNVYQQRFDRHGQTIGGEMVVNMTAEGSQLRNVVTSLDDGGWLVGWLSDGALYQQRFDANGEKRGVETAVSPEGVDTVASSIVQLADGGWIVTYSTSLSTMDVYQARYDQFGVQVGTVELVSETGWSLFPYATALPDGGWIVTWTLDLNEIWQARYDLEGNASSLEKINTSSADSIGETPVATLEDGGWVVAWWTTNDSTDEESIRFQRFGADGGRVDGETIVATDGASAEVFNVTMGGVAALEDGGWVVTWLVGAEDPEDTTGSVMFQRYGADGQAVGGSVQASYHDQMHVDYASVAGLEDGGWLITWSNFGADGDGDGVYQARYTADGAEVIGILPKAADNAITMLEDDIYVFSASDFGFTDGDNGTFGHVTVKSLPQNGVLSLNGISVSIGSEIAAADLSSLAWIPDADANGDALASFDFTVTDSDGATSLDTFNISFDVTPVNDAPVGSDRIITLSEDTSYRFQLSDFGFDDVEGHSLSHIEIYVPAVGFGSLTLNGTKVDYLQIVDAEDITSLVWTPDEDIFGEYLSLLSYRITDDGGTANGGDDSDNDLRAIRFHVEDVVDRIKGTNHKDKLVGTDGDDMIWGRRGDDILIGGLGSDEFIIGKRSGKDKIKDFDATSADGDILSLSDVQAIKNWRDLRKHHLDERGDDVIIDINRSDKIILKNVDIDDIDKSDFLF